MNLMDHLNNAHESLFRFEGLQEYDVEHEKEAIRAFKENGVVDDSHMQGWWDFIQKKKSEGVVMQRVRLVVAPYTDYLQMELGIHKKSAERGDDIRIISENEFQKLNIKLQDFWLIDDQKVLVMNYDEKGAYLSFTIQEDTERFIQVKKMLLEHSESISSTDFHGVKIAIMVDRKVLMHLRDDKPGLFNANMWDFPGGGREGSETPEECAIREIQEELGITLSPGSFVWQKVYPAQKDPNQKAFFMVAKIPAEEVKKIVLTEGQRWDLFDTETFFAKEDIIPALKERFRDYLETVQ